MEKEKYKEAANAYIQAIKYNEDNADLYYNLGIAYSRINEFPLARKCFEKTVETNSNYYNAYYRLGQISLLYRDIENAENYFIQSMYEETEGKSYFQLAKIYMIKNDRNKAVMFANKAIEFDSNYFSIINQEPIFLPIIKQIKKPEENENKETKKESEKEKLISEYLDNTYDLTKVLNEKENKRKI
ncbi:MAG: tetratricopeptide repeat protein [Clostridia bacterium]|nr:tetratricopeptide repeat protein [Clostridia bacterium]